MENAQIEVLVLAAQEGKKQALDLLYRHFFTPMKRYAVLRVRDAMVAEDLVQNVWLKVSKRLQLLQDARVFRSWLYRALRWEIMDWGRRQKVAQTDELGESELAAPAVMAETLDIDRLLMGLSKDERDVVELFYLNELSVNETALVLVIPAGTVKSRLHSAREKFRKEYLEKNHEC